MFIYPLDIVDIYNQGQKPTIAQSEIQRREAKILVTFTIVENIFSIANKYSIKSNLNQVLNCYLGLLSLNRTFPPFQFYFVSEMRRFKFNSYGALQAPSLVSQMVLCIRVILEMIIYEIILKYSEHRIEKLTKDHTQNAKIISSVIYKIVTLILKPIPIVNESLPQNISFRKPLQYEQQQRGQGKQIIAGLYDKELNDFLNRNNSWVLMMKARILDYLKGLRQEVQEVFEELFGKKYFRLYQFKSK